MIDTTERDELQNRLPGETEKAYMAYLIYRDSPLPRTDSEGYRRYKYQLDGAWPESTGIGSIPSGGYRRWKARYKWEERIAAWDALKRESIVAIKLEEDAAGFLGTVDRLRLQIEESSQTGLHGSQAAINICAGQLAVILKSTQTAKGEFPTALTKPDIDRVATIVRSLKDSIDAMAAAKFQMFDALGLVEISQGAKHIEAPSD